MLPLLFFVVLALRKGSRRFESTRLTTTNCATCLPSRRFNILQCKMPQGNPDTNDFDEEKLADLYNNKPWWECALLIPFDLHDHIWSRLLNFPRTNISSIEQSVMISTWRKCPCHRNSKLGLRLQRRLATSTNSACCIRSSIYGDI